VIHIRKILAKWLYPKAFEEPGITLSMHHCYTVLGDNDTFLGFMGKHFPGEGTNLKVRGLFICTTKDRMEEAERAGNVKIARDLRKLMDNAEIEELWERAQG
jgi:hypothetical protein